MSSADVIDALFNRTVDIVQSLPKAGPIQTSYEEKLALYSLYKQATEGDVSSKRPGMLDMLGRAKWDAWAQRQGTPSLEAKQLYVESMMRTLRKFGNRREARDLIDQLESFSGQVAERVMRGALDDTTTDSLSDSGAESSSSRGVPRHPLPPRGRGSAAAASANASAGPSRAGAPSAGSLTPQLSRGGGGGGGHRAMAAGGHPHAHGMESIASRSESDSESETGSDEDDDGDEDRRRYAAAQQPPAPRDPRPRPPPSAFSQRRPGPGSIQGAGAGYASSQRSYPAPPRSESNMGGGAGASLYSNRRGTGSTTGGRGVGGDAPPPVEHHYYHRGRAPPSSAGGGGGGPAGGSTTGRGAPPVAASPRVDEALTSIQASLAALHERLNRVEARGGGGGSVGRRGSTTGGLLFTGAYTALWNAFHDVANLIGISTGSSSTSASHATPSFGEQPSASTQRHSRPSRFRLALNVVLALVNLSLRLTLDMTSLAILLTVVLFAVKRLTGRGDPLVIMRVLRGLVGRRRVDRVARGAAATVAAE